MKKLLVISGLVAAMSAVSMAQASPGEMYFQGNLIASTCVVNGTSNNNFTIAMGDVDFASLIKDDISFVQTEFEVEVDCSGAGTLKTANLRLFPNTRQGSGTNGKFLKLDAMSSTASGADIAVIDEDDKILDLETNPRLEKELDVTDPDSVKATFSLKAAMVRNSSPRVPGDFSATLPFIVSLH